jgi:selenocysteine lyase/cysteine desulfurase
VQRGAGATAASTSARFAASRASVGRFVGARPSDVVVFTRNTTDALTLLSRCLPAESQVVHLVSEHHANMLPWRQGRSVALPIPVRLEDVPGVIEAALRDLPPGPHLVAIAGASNVTGELLPVRAISAVAHQAGARVVVDAAQLAGHSPLNMATLGADYLALSGHKMYAPFGCGALVGRRDWLDAAEPYLPGGGAVVRVDAVGQSWAASPERHEGGTPNVLGAVALATAANALRDHGLGRLARREAALHVALRDGLAALPGVRLLSMWNGPGVGICSFTVEGIAPALLAAALEAEHGIGVRVGAFCAQPLVSQLLGAQTACSTSGPAAVRASVGVGTTAADVEFFLVAVQSLLTRGPTCRYETDGVTWLPVQRSAQPHEDLSALVEPHVVDHTYAHADSR